MDVRCEQCGTEYEFDDAKVTDAGIAVKCTHCGFLFRVTRQPVTVEQRPVVVEQRPTRGPTTEVPQLPKAKTPTRARGWMIRKERSGEILEFKDLSTLQKWILERKVSRDDEISKTGESWKPLGSIVELSSFFLVVEGEALRGATQQPAPEPPAPPTQTGTQASAIRPSLAPPAPPRGRDDLLDSGKFRLEGPDDLPTPAPTPLHTEPELVGQPALPQAAQASPLPRVTETATTRRVQIPAPDPTPQVTVLRGAPRPALGRQEASVPGYDLGSVSGPVGRGNTARGFVIGVAVTGALFAVAYGAFEHLNQDRERPATKSPAVDAAGPPSAAAGLDLPTRLDAADARVRTDADSELDLAIHEYDALLLALGEPPSDRVLAARVLVGKAHVLLARAEHRRLGGEAPGAILAKVNDLLGAARVNAPELPDVDLAWADSLRLRDERVSVRNFLDTAAPSASLRPNYAFLRAMAEGSDDPGSVADRLAALPPEARSIPRVLLLRGLALETAGRRDEAIAVVTELLRASPSHVQGIDLKSRLASHGLAPASWAAVASVSPPTAPPPTAPPTAATSAPPASSHPTVAQPASAPPTGPPRIASPSTAPSAEPPGEGGAGDFDALMLRGSRNLEAGRPEVAARFFEKASKLKPRSPEPFANLGWCHVDQHRYAEAIARFQSALALSPRYSDALYGIAEAHEKAGQSSEAATAYKTYLDAHPTGRRAEMARRRLDRLQ